MSEPFEPIERRDPFAGLNDGGRKPSIEGRDSLAWAMAELVPKKREPKHKPWWKKWFGWWFKHPKLLAVFLLADLVLGHYAWGYLFAANPGAAKGAVDKTLNDVAHHNWSGVYDSLCQSDRAQINESDLAAAGQVAILQLGAGLARWSETSVTDLRQTVGPINLPAEQVSGQLFPVAGTPSDYTVVVVRELSGWHVCMSAGGFSMLGYTEPLGSGLSQLSQ